MASTRLTNYQRDAFVTAVIDDIPKVDYDESMRKFLQAFAVTQLPEKLKPLYKLYPEFFEHNTIYTPSCFSNVSVVCADSKELKDKLEQSVEAHQQYEALTELYNSQRETISALRAKVRGMIYSVISVEKAHELMPEFAKYLGPKGAPIDRSVPVIANVVADLLAAGWPKEQV